MPADARIGRELAEILTNAYLGKIREVRFTYDPEIQLDDLPDDPYVFIAPQALRVIREGRTAKRKAAQLRLICVSKQGAADDPYFIDAQLDSFDMLVDTVFDTKVGDPVTAPLAIEYEDRYDLEKFETHRRLVTAISITYGNV